MGYGEGKVTNRTNDGGIDGIIDEDKLGFDKVHIQAKRWNPGNNIGRRELQGLLGHLPVKVVVRKSLSPHQILLMKPWIIIVPM